MRPRAFFLFCAALFVTALAIRLIHLHQIRPIPLFDHLIGDAAGYDDWARQIASGQWLGRDVFYQAPLYPYFLATLYKIVGHSLLGVRIVQSALGAGACVLLAMAGREFFSPRVGVVAGARWDHPEVRARPRAGLPAAVPARRVVESAVDAALDRNRRDAGRADADARKRGRAGRRDPRVDRAGAERSRARAAAESRRVRRRGAGGGLAPGGAAQRDRRRRISHHHRPTRTQPLHRQQPGRRRRVRPAGLRAQQPAAGARRRHRAGTAGRRTNAFAQ